jgi:hypothetical protein
MHPEIQKLKDDVQAKNWEGFKARVAEHLKDFDPDHSEEFCQDEELNAFYARVVEIGFAFNIPYNIAAATAIAVTLENSAWIPCDQRPPIKKDFLAFCHSEEVLFTDGKEQWVGYLQTWLDDEYEPTWKMKGSEEREVEHITLWRHLPPQPNEKGQQ